MDPMKILPPKMWQQVFHRVKRAQDWLNLYAASPFFEEVVGRERHEALFPQVLPHVHKFLEGTLQELLHLRLVSHKWREAVDVTIEKKPASDKLKKACTLLFCRPERISRFLDTFENPEEVATSLNPIIGGSVTFFYVYMLMRRGNEEMMALVTRFMRRFGDGVRHLVILGGAVGLEALDALELIDLHHPLGSSLQFAPNVESLRIVLKPIHRYFGEGEGEEEAPRGQVYDEPCPAIMMPKLKSFEFCCGSHQSGVPMFQDEIQLFQENVQNFALRLLSPSTRDSLQKIDVWGLPTELNSISFPNLRSAALTFRTEAEMARLMSSSCNWPLADLTWKDELGWVGLRDVFRVVETFKTTLTSLQIHKTDAAMSERMISDDVFFRVDLPALKSLKIPHIYPVKVSGNFPSLEVLEVDSWRRIYIYQQPQPPPLLMVAREDQDVYSNEEILQSNLWEIFPKLRKLFVGGRRNGKFERGMHELHCLAASWVCRIDFHLLL